MKIFTFCLLSVLSTYPSAAQEDFWQSTTGLPATSISNFTSMISGEIFAVVDSIVYISTDDGMSWDRTLRSIEGVASARMATDTSGHIFIPSNGRVFISSDRGNSWSLSARIPDIMNSPTGFTASPNGFLYYGSNAGIARSTDLGATWGWPLQWAVIGEMVTRPNGEIVAGGGYQVHSSVGFTAVGDAYHSTDQGETWTSISDGMHDKLWVDANRSVFMYRLTGGSLTLRTEIFRYGCCYGSGGGLQAAGGFRSLAADQSGVIFATNGRGVIFSIDNATTWDTVNSGLPDLSAGTLHVTPGNHLLVSLSTGVYRSVQSMSIVIPPPAPVREYPWDEAERPLTLTFSWYAVLLADRYQLQISTSPSFDTTFVDDSTITATSSVVGPLSDGTRYYWRVRGLNEAGAGPWSSVGSFATLTISTEPPLAPVPVAPANGQTVRPGLVLLTWQLVTTADRYHLQVSTNPSFDPTIVDDSTITPTWVVVDVVIDALLEGTTYYWRARGVNEAGAGAWSSSFFSTARTPPEGYAVFQNYPNPFNATTTFSFTLDQASHVTLRIYDLLGRELTTLLDQPLPLGYQTMRWEAAGLEAGVYVARLQYANHLETHKVVYLR
jgi:hypothetical protein